MESDDNSKCLGAYFKKTRACDLSFFRTWNCSWKIFHALPRCRIVNLLQIIHYCLFLLFWLFLLLFFETGFLCVALAVLELRNLPASAPQELGLKACATTARLVVFFMDKTGCFRSIQASDNLILSTELGSSSSCSVFHKQGLTV